MMQAISDWLASSRLSHLLADAGWFVPTAQAIHILAIAAVVTLLSMLNFRLLGLTGRGPPAHNLAGYYIPWVWRGLVILLVSGALLTITEPERELMNISFRIKMLLVLALAIVTFVEHSSFLADSHYCNRSRHHLMLMRTLAAVSLVLCVTIVAAGRLIAYS